MKKFYSLQSNHSNSSGFTLIELLVVIAILGILSSVVLVAINPKQRIAEAYDSQMRADLGLIQSALEAYSTQNEGKYPSTVVNGTLRVFCEKCSYPWYIVKGKDQWIPDLVDRGYLKSLPTSPLDGKGESCGGNYANRYAAYLYYSDGTNYKLWAFCMPTTGLNRGSSYGGPYCTPPYTSYSSFNDSSDPNRKLKPMVDPRSPTNAYVIYSPDWICRF